MKQQSEMLMMKSVKEQTLEKNQDFRATYKIILFPVWNPNYRKKKNQAFHLLYHLPNNWVGSSTQYVPSQTSALWNLGVHLPSQCTCLLKPIKCWYKEFRKTTA